MVDTLTMQAFTGLGITKRQISQFQYADNFTVNFRCKACERCLTNIASLQVVKCSGLFCQVHQCVADCCKVGSIRLSITEEGEDIWLTVKDDVPVCMLAKLNEKYSKDPEVTIDSPKGDILSLILGATDMLELDVNSRIPRSFAF